MELHIQTTMFMVCVIYLTMHAVIWFALPEQRNQQVWLWSASGLMSGLGVIALSTRGIVSEFVFIYIGQALMVLGNAGRCLSLRMFLPPVSRKAIWFHLVSSTVFLLALGGGFAAGVPEFYLRILYFSFYAIILMDYFLMGQRLSQNGRSVGATFLMGAGLGLSVTHALKVGGLLTQPYNPDIYAESFDQYLFVLGQYICIPLANIGFLRVFLENRQRMRLETERELAAAEASREALARHHEELTLLLQEREEIIRQLTLSNKNAAMGALVASLAHELNQPLCSIGLNLSLIERKLRGQSGEADGLQNVLNAVKSENRRAADIILKLRKLFEQGTGAYEAVNMRELIEDCAALLGARAIRENIVVSMSLQEADVVQADRTQLQQVILNLLNNAMDAVSASDKSEKRIRISAHNDSTQLVISVEDNGIGISADDQPSVFELFKTSKSDGMGVGLWLSRTVVNAHGGEIQLLSQEGEGARFDVSLPVAVMSTSLGSATTVGQAAA